MYMQFSSIGGGEGRIIALIPPIEGRAMHQFYTYAHKRADDGRIFYIGKGKGKRHQSAGNRNRHWRNIVNKHGFTAEILADWETEDEAFEHEKVLIESFRRMGYELANLTDGGEGVSGLATSEETRAQLSEKKKRHWSSPEARAAQGEKVKRHWSSPEVRAAHSERLRQAFASPEARAAQGEKSKRYWSSPEARAAHGEARKGRVWVINGAISAFVLPDSIPAGFVRGRFASPEARAQLIERSKKALADPEVRARMSEIKKGRVWVNDGTISKSVFPDDIPAGFVRGRLPKKSCYDTPSV